MPCFIVSPDADDARTAKLGKLAAQLGLSVSIVPDLDGLSSRQDFAETPRPLVLFPDPGAEGAMADAAIRFAQTEQGHGYLIYISDLIAPEAYKRLLRTDAAEWSKWESVPQELGEVVQRLAGIEPMARAAKIVAFLPSKGGVGNTRLALETAAFLSSQPRRGGYRVAILDLNFQGGTLADALDIEPRFDLRELTGTPDRLDNQLIEIFASRYSERLDVFASPLRRRPPDPIDPAMIFSVLDLIASRYELLLLDIPNQSLPWIDNLVLGSDAIIVSGESTVPALKQLAATLAHLDDLSIPSAKLGVVVNQCEASLLGGIVRRGEIAAALPQRRIFPVRSDSAAVGEAANAGRPLMDLSPGNRVAKDLRQVASWIEETVGHARKAANKTPGRTGKDAMWGTRA